MKKLLTGELMVTYQVSEFVATVKFLHTSTVVCSPIADLQVYIS